jgi:prefoldin alpha subunit
MENQQEMIMKFGAFEEQIKQIQEQTNAVEHGILELKTLHFGLDDLKGKEGKEILASLGRGLFVKANLISEEVLVDIGNQTFVKKTIEETKTTIDSQIQKLKEAQEELKKMGENINQEMTQLFMQFQESKKD